jgi:hypothetical protein
MVHSVQTSAPDSYDAGRLRPADNIASVRIVSLPNFNGEIIFVQGAIRRRELHDTSCSAGVDECRMGPFGHVPRMYMHGAIAWIFPPFHQLSLKSLIWLKVGRYPIGDSGVSSSPGHGSPLVNGSNLNFVGRTQPYSKWRKV